MQSIAWWEFGFALMQPEIGPDGGYITPSIALVSRKLEREKQALFVCCMSDRSHRIGFISRELRYTFRPGHIELIKDPAGALSSYVFEAG